jgi:hypothetical protein
MATKKVMQTVQREITQHATQLEFVKIDTIPIATIPTDYRFEAAQMAELFNTGKATVHTDAPEGFSLRATAIEIKRTVEIEEEIEVDVPLEDIEIKEALDDDPYTPPGFVVNDSNDEYAQPIS